MKSLDHVAINVLEIGSSLNWYVENANAYVEYSDETWALLTVGDAKLALTVANEHPPHIAINIETPDEFPKGSEINIHRDGSWYYYDKDPSGNIIEWIYYPPEDNI